VVDVDQQRGSGPDPDRDGAAAYPGEEVLVHEQAAAIAGERRAERHQSSWMPVDDRFERLDHGQGAHPLVLESSCRRAPETQPADDDVELLTVQPG
jgi:hypothetical protein